MNKSMVLESILFLFSVYMYGHTLVSTLLSVSASLKLYQAWNHHFVSKLFVRFTGFAISKAPVGNWIQTKMRMTSEAFYQLRQQCFDIKNENLRCIMNERHIIVYCSMILILPKAYDIIMIPIGHSFL